MWQLGHWDFTRQISLADPCQPPAESVFCQSLNCIEFHLRPFRFSFWRNKKAAATCCPLKPPEEDKEEIKEATVSLAAAREMSVDASVD